jgi:hypothetical protein
MPSPLRYIALKRLVRVVILFHHGNDWRRS